jgi:hypothetical protein
MGTANAKSADGMSASTLFCPNDLVWCSRNHTGNKPQRVTNQSPDERYQMWNDAMRLSRSGLNQSRSMDNVLQSTPRQGVDHKKKVENGIQAPRIRAPSLKSPRNLFVPRRSSMRFASDLDDDKSNPGREQRVAYVGPNNAQYVNIIYPSMGTRQETITMQNQGDGSAICVQ